MSLEIKIGNIELTKDVEPFLDNWRFVLAKEKETISLYAILLPTDGSSFICNIAVERNVLDPSIIIGGGGINYVNGTLEFVDWSVDYGIIPNEFMRELAPVLVEHMKEKYPIDDVKINMWYDPETSPQKSSAQIKKWEKMGYSFDNQKSVLEFNIS